MKFRVGCVYTGEHGGDSFATVTYKVLSIEKKIMRVEILNETATHDKCGIGSKQEFRYSGCKEDVLIKESIVELILKEIDELEDR